uniref:TerD domain-containing protein n=1 Tax=Alexandrium monilatum TaxID=311494 RepID=A0A7S4PTF7_9DINO
MAAYDARGAKVLRRLDTKGIPEDFELHKARYGVGVSWDAGRVDIDLQCVVVDTSGAIIDCAYYNNMKAGRGITHSGDAVVGKPNGIQELIWVTLPKLSQSIAALVFVVAAYSGGFLRDVQGGKLRLLEESEKREIAQFELERSAASVDVVAAMFRGAGGLWSLRIIDEPAQQGQHFMDILPLLADTIRIFLPQAPRRQKVAFAMEKGGVLDLPQGMGKITVGLGWDPADDDEVDLDVSAILLDRNGNDIEAVFFGRLECEEHGIFHSGDNLTGEGDGDDEQIVCELERIGPAVQQVFFVINIYSAKRTFRNVSSPYCRVVDGSDESELCRYALQEAGNQNGLIIAKIAREAGDRWGFHALGLPCTGRTFKDSLPDIRKASTVKTASLMLRRSSTTDLGAASHGLPVASAFASPAPTAPPPPTAPGYPVPAGAAYGAPPPRAPGYPVPAGAAYGAPAAAYAAPPAVAYARPPQAKKQECILQ